MYDDLRLHIQLQATTNHGEEKKVKFESRKPSLESFHKFTPASGEKKESFGWNSIVSPNPSLQPSLDPIPECKSNITTRSISERFHVFIRNGFMAAMLTGEELFGLYVSCLSAIGIFLTLLMVKYVSSKINRNRKVNGKFIMSYDTLKKSDSNAENPSFMQSVSYVLQNSGKNLYEQCTKFCATRHAFDADSVNNISENFRALKNREEQEYHDREEEKEEFWGHSESYSASESFESFSSELGSNVPDANIVCGQWSQLCEIGSLREMGMRQSGKADEATAISSPYVDVTVEEKSDNETRNGAEMNLMSLDPYYESSMNSLSSTVVHPSVSPVSTVTNKSYKSTYPFDGNGIINYLTSMEKYKVRVKMSTVFAGSEKDIISQSSKFDSTYTENEVNSWVALDLGQGRRLIPTNYYIRHGASVRGNALRNWQLRARVRENDNWEILNVHVNDNTLSEEPWSTAKWEIQLPLWAEVHRVINLEKAEEESPVSKGYRYFLILQTSINSSNNNCLFIGGIEFDGFLSERP